MDTGTRLTIWVMRGLAETIVSAMLEKSTIKYPFVVYEYSQIKITKTEFTVAVKAACFLADGYDLIPLEKLYRKFTGGSLAVDTAHQGEIKNQIKFLVNFVEQTTGLQNFGQYLTSMLEIDAFFLNEDRHTNNIAVQYKQLTIPMHCAHCLIMACRFCGIPIWISPLNATWRIV